MIEYTGIPKTMAFLVFVEVLEGSFVMTANVFEDTEVPISPPCARIFCSISAIFPPVNTIDLPDNVPVCTGAASNRCMCFLR